MYNKKKLHWEKKSELQDILLLKFPQYYILPWQYFHSQVVSSIFLTAV